MKFIVEENLSPDIQVLVEGEGKKSMFIEGVFAEADRVNRNKRVYPKPVMENATQVYIEEYVKPKRAFGECEHPKGPMVSIDRVSHLITELEMQGTQVVGKAKLLETPLGNIIKTMIEAGGIIGVSTRGIGSVQLKESIEHVKNDYKIYAIDIVHTPSAHNAFVNGIMEGVEWFVNPDGSLKAEAIEHTKQALDLTFKPTVSREDRMKQQQVILEQYFNRIMKF